MVIHAQVTHQSRISIVLAWISLHLRPKPLLNGLGNRAAMKSARLYRLWYRRAIYHLLLPPFGYQGQMDRASILQIVYKSMLLEQDRIVVRQLTLRGSKPCLGQQYTAWRDLLRHPRWWIVPLPYTPFLGFLGTASIGRRSMRVLGLLYLCQQW